MMSDIVEKQQRSFPPQHNGDLIRKKSKDKKFSFLFELWNWVASTLPFPLCTGIRYSDTRDPALESTYKSAKSAVKYCINSFIFVFLEELSYFQQWEKPMIRPWSGTLLTHLLTESVPLSSQLNWLI